MIMTYSDTLIYEEEEMSTFEKVKKVVVDQLSVDADTITEASSFKEDLGADSLDIAQIIMGIEDEFGISIPQEEAEKIVFHNFYYCL